ncbi:amidohydrolase [Thermogemmatispora aurantia]|jgi:predicted amidohydrolase|uniref:Amidohydrolase n=1 Tax=Thermogemmatispora aurantia TaxID=2045279 RepID=A0A5J4K9M8_9CHLR|nr:nitrilase-related carbon-nitrogen hydrolase [Thermogemmatispora aurantia]GER83391.1 amidohydrolase [Thermogemmatispora aurantia]
MSTSASSFTRYRVAAIQYEPTPGQKEQNIGDLLRLVEEAARHGARLIVLPELATTGYCWESREEIAPYVEPVPGPTCLRFAELAAAYGCYIALSLAEVDPESDVYYNTTALLGPQGLLGKYRKLHSYIAEPRWARDGDLGLPVWDTPLGRLAILVCMDAMYFEAARLAAVRGAEVLLFPCGWLDEKCPSSWWMLRAFENGVYLIAANRYGRERGVQFSGGSCILNPDGSIQAYRDDGEGIVYGEVDLERCRNKQWGPAGEEPLGDRLADRRPREYVSLVHNTYLWEPLRFHGLYQSHELPPGQLSCAAFVQLELREMLAAPEEEQTAAIATVSNEERLERLRSLVRSLLRVHEPAYPDVLVLPELALPGPSDPSHPDFAARIRAGAIRVPGPEIEALVALATEFQLSIVLGVAECTYADGNPEPVYYNTVLLLDPEGVHGIYRKLHLTRADRRWASPGNLGLPTFDSPVGRIGLATGYDVLFPETLRVLAGKGCDLVCAPTLLNFPNPSGLGPTAIPFGPHVAPEGYDPLHYLPWRIRAAEHHVYLTIANWSGEAQGVRANGFSGIYSPSCSSYPWREVIAEEGESTLMLMTIDTREQRTGRRSTTLSPAYMPGDVAGSLTGELAYDIRETIPGNVVRAKPLLRKRQPLWYLDLVRPAAGVASSAPAESPATPAAR